jgi:hypothetical protein
MPTTPTPLRYTLDCQAVAWDVLHVEESTSLARPPGVVLDVTTDRSLAELGEVERTTASLLIETQSSSRVVRGWVRCVEAIGVIDARAHLRLHLVPLVMAEDAPVRRVEVDAPAVAPDMLAASLPAPAEEEWAVAPAMVPGSRVVEPLPLGEQDVTAEHPPEELRAMRGEEAEEEVLRSAVARPRAKGKQEFTDVAPRSGGQDSAHEQSPVRTGGTQLMTREDLERLKTAAPAVRPKGAVTETERLRSVTGAAEDGRPSPHREARDEPPERKRPKKRKADDETAQLTWAQLEALHRDRGKPKP